MSYTVSKNTLLWCSRLMLRDHPIDPDLLLTLDLHRDPGVRLDQMRRIRPLRILWSMPGWIRLLRSAKVRGSCTMTESRKSDTSNSDSGIGSAEPWSSLWLKRQSLGTFPGSSSRICIVWSPNAPFENFRWTRPSSTSSSPLTSSWVSLCESVSILNKIKS